MLALHLLASLKKKIWSSQTTSPVKAANAPTGCSPRQSLQTSDEQSVRGGASVSEGAEQGPSNQSQTFWGLVLHQNKNINKGAVTVSQVVPGGLSIVAGIINVGDELRAIDDTLCFDMDTTTIDTFLAMASPASSRDKAGSGLARFGITITDTIPHQITQICPNGPMAKNNIMAIEDVLVAIEDEFVADLPMEDITKLASSNKSGDVVLWIEKAQESHAYHERGESFRYEIAKLRALRDDGLLEPEAYSASIDALWKFCYKVVAHDQSWAIEETKTQSDACAIGSESKNTVFRLTFYRPSDGTEYTTCLPRLSNMQSVLLNNKNNSKKKNNSERNMDQNKNSNSNDSSEDSTVWWGKLRTASSFTGADSKRGVDSARGSVGELASIATTRSSSPLDGAGVGCDGEVDAQCAAVDVLINKNDATLQAVHAKCQVSDKMHTTNSHKDDQQEQDQHAQCNEAKKATSTHEICGDSGDECPQSSCKSAMLRDCVSCVNGFVRQGGALGLGLFQQREGEGVVVADIETSGTAYLSGVVRLHDHLIEVDGASVCGMDVKASCNLISNGCRDAHVTLTFLRHNTERIVVILPRPDAPAGAACSCRFCVIEPLPTPRVGVTAVGDISVETSPGYAHGTDASFGEGVVGDVEGSEEVKGVKGEVHVNKLVEGMLQWLHGAKHIQGLADWSKQDAGKSCAREGAAGQRKKRTSRGEGRVRERGGKAKVAAKGDLTRVVQGGLADLEIAGDLCVLSEGDVQCSESLWRYARDREDALECLDMSGGAWKGHWVCEQRGRGGAGHVDAPSVSLV